MPVIKVKSEEVKIKVPITTLRIEPTTQTKTVEPTIEKQVITPDEGVFALSSVIVNSVTSEIDENIKAENIKEGVSILGVEGGAKVATPDMVNLSEYLETTITSENSQRFFSENFIKKFPENFNVETTNFSYLFYNWKYKTLPNIDTSRATSIYYMFGSCSNITSIPDMNTSNCEDFSNFLNGASKVTTVPLLDFSKANQISYMVLNASAITDLGGFKNLGKGYNRTSANFSNFKLDLSYCKKLTEQSLINVLNNLYDIASMGIGSQQCVLSSTNLAKLTSEEGQQALANAQAKGWTVS